MSYETPKTQFTASFGPRKGENVSFTPGQTGVKVLSKIIGRNINEKEIGKYSISRRDFERKVMIRLPLSETMLNGDSIVEGSTEDFEELSLS